MQRPPVGMGPPAPSPASIEQKEPWAALREGCGAPRVGDPRLTLESEQPRPEGGGGERPGCRFCSSAWDRPGEQVEAFLQLVGGRARQPLQLGAASRSDSASVAQLEGTEVRLPDELPGGGGGGGKGAQRGSVRPGSIRWHARRGAWRRAPEARGRAGSAGRAHSTRVRARSRHAGRPGPLSVQTAAPADARAPIGAPRPPPAAPEALGPQLLGGWTRRGPAPPPARPRPRGPWSRGPARGRPPARRFMERPRPGRRGQRDPAGPCEPPAPRHHVAG